METGYFKSRTSQRAAAKMAESEDEDSSLNLTGFLFGNINEKGELEDTEILDEVIYSIEWFTAVIALRKMRLYWMQTSVDKCPSENHSQNYLVYGFSFLLVVKFCSFNGKEES